MHIEKMNMLETKRLKIHIATDDEKPVLSQAEKWAMRVLSIFGKADNYKHLLTR